MNRLCQLIVLVLALAFPTASFADGQAPRNGNGFILRDQLLLVHRRGQVDETLVVVAKEAEIRAVAVKLRTGNLKCGEIRIESSGTIARVRADSDLRLVGRERGTGRLVVVVSEFDAWEFSDDTEILHVSDD